MPEDFDRERWMRDYRHLVTNGWANSSEAREDEHEAWITATRQRLAEDGLLAKIEIVFNGPRGTTPHDFGWTEHAFVALARLLSPTGGPNYPNPGGLQPDFEEKRRKIVELAERDWGETLERARIRIASELK